MEMIQDDFGWPSALSMKKGCLYGNKTYERGLMKSSLSLRSWDSVGTQALGLGQQAREDLCFIDLFLLLHIIDIDTYLGFTSWCHAIFSHLAANAKPVHPFPTS